MNNRYINLFRFFFVCVDLFLLNVINFVLMLTIERIPEHAQQRYMVLFFIANMFWLISAYSTGLYIDSSNPSFERFTKRTIKSIVLFYILMLFFIFLYHYSFSRLFIVASFSGFALALLFTRFLLVGASLYLDRVSKVNKKIVIVGYNEVAKKLAYKFSTQNRNSR
jgi:putative colanic acid biosysnthesis UDP-glucose lipid carrier transferase